MIGLSAAGINMTAPGAKEQSETRPTVTDLSKTTSLLSPDGHNTTMHPTTKDNAINCAVYTRVSVDERAETQTYSTLDNQRDSCIAYIESQKSLGWKVFKVYEDAGQSGGSLNRPALKQLIEDIKRKRIQTLSLIHI